VVEPPGIGVWSALRRCWLAVSSVGGFGCLRGLGVAAVVPGLAVSLSWHNGFDWDPAHFRDTCI